MIRRIDLRGSHADPRAVLPRAAMDVADAQEHVRPIIAEVRDEGATAIARWSERLDRVVPPMLRTWRG